jgi:hypothetical protein
MPEPVALKSSFRNPLHMIGNLRMPQQQLTRVVVPAHFFLAGNELVDGVVAFPAEVEAAGTHFFQGEVFSEPDVPVARLRNQVVKGEAGKVFTFAQIAGAVRAALGDFSLGSWIPFSTTHPFNPMHRSVKTLPVTRVFNRFLTRASGVQGQKIQNWA